MGINRSARSWGARKRGQPASLRVWLGLAVLALTLAGAGAAWAFQALPVGGQVNDDAAAGINKTLSVGADDPTNADVVGGALTAGKVAVPWAVFQQQTTGFDQIFVRSFAGGAWTTRGSGTVGGQSSASPTSSGSLNFNQGTDGDVPSIDFAGAGRTVPWATWYEDTSGTGFNNNNIFASSFDNTGDANQGKWLFAGQDRGLTGTPTAVPTPSLNINTNQDAENPVVAGGSAANPSSPGPWIAWQETTSAPVNGADQIFVERPIGPGMANCDGVTPAGVTVSGHVPTIGGFCWQEVGNPRVGAGSADPSLNVDPARDGVEPDIAFTGPSDSVPWVVWYENNTRPPSSGLHTNELVFAAKAVADPNPPAIGGFHWVVVGSALQGTLDTTGTNAFGPCAASAVAEGQCSLNHDPNADAEDPRVAAGTMTPGGATAPWVAWDELVGGVRQIFVARLVGGTAFQLANGGAPISTGSNDSTRPDITFSGNTPYVTWREDVGGGVEQAFAGHFTNAANPTFVLDESDVPLTPHTQADVREPISSSCTANPFNQDGAACQGTALGTPFFLFTNGTSPRSLFADAYQATTPVTSAATAITTSGATLNGSVDPNGATASVFFQYGPTTAYGQTTAAQATGPADSLLPFTAALSGLSAGATLHYRLVVVSDFGTLAGADQTVTTATPPPPPPPPPGPGTVTLGKLKVSGTAVTVQVSCQGASGATCALTFTLTVKETLRGHRVVAVTARRHRRTSHKTVTVGSASGSLAAGQTETGRVSLNGTGRALLRRRHHLKARLRVTQALTSGTATLKSATVKFKRSH